MQVSELLRRRAKVYRGVRVALVATVLQALDLVFGGRQHQQQLQGQEEEEEEEEKEEEEEEEEEEGHRPG